MGLIARHTDVSLWYIICFNQKDYLVYDKSEFNSVKWFSLDEGLNLDTSKTDPNLPRFILKLKKDLSIKNRR